MRKTAREKYIEGLEDAAGSLFSFNVHIRIRLKETGQLSGAYDEFNAWKEETAALIERYSGHDDSDQFLNQFALNPNDLSIDYVTDAMHRYDLLVTELSTIDVRRGYDDDVRIPLEQLDELFERLADSLKRSTDSEHLDNQTASEGLRRWKEHAHSVLTTLVGEGEAAEIYSMKPANSSWGNPDGSIEERYAMYLKYIRNLKEDIQKYPHHLVPGDCGPEFPRTMASTKSQSYVDGSRLQELKSIKSQDIDLSRLIALCSELNVTSSGGAHHATGMLVRAIMDHVPPIFGVSGFGQVTNNYAGSRSFKEAMAALDSAARKIGDAHLHTQIRKSEVLPTATQVNFSQQLDMLLAEVVRLLK